MTDIIALILLAVGAAFDLFGCIGLVRLPDVYNRVQGATKCVTLGTCLMLFGVALYVGTGEVAAKALLCAGFVLLTSPVAAHAIAQAAHRSGVPLWEGSVMDKYREDREGQAAAGEE